MMKVMEMVGAYAAWAAMTAGMVAYVYNADAMIDKMVDAVEAMIAKVSAKAADATAKYHGDLIAMYGEAADA